LVSLLLDLLALHPSHPSLTTTSSSLIIFSFFLFANDPELVLDDITNNYIPLGHSQILVAKVLAISVRLTSAIGTPTDEAAIADRLHRGIPVQRCLRAQATPPAWAEDTDKE
jgi:hypothetical protein